MAQRLQHSQPKPAVGEALVFPPGLGVPPVADALEAFAIRLAGRVVLAFLLSGLALASPSSQVGEVAQEEEEQEEEQNGEELPAARQNALLRSHFREMYPRYVSGWSNRGFRSLENDEFAERFIDRQIDNYLKDIEDQLAQLETNLTAAELLRERILTYRADPATDQEYREALGRFEMALNKVQNHAGNLKDQLEYAFSGLEGKKKLTHKIDSTSLENFYEEELRFLRRRAQEAERRIRDYLFFSVNTVDVKELQQETMLVCLYQVQQMAKEIRKSLK